MKRTWLILVLLVTFSTTSCTVLIGGGAAGAGATTGWLVDRDNNQDGKQIGFLLGLFVGAAVGIYYDNKLWNRLKCKYMGARIEGCPTTKLGRSK